MRAAGARTRGKRQADHEVPFDATRANRLADQRSFQRNGAAESPLWRSGRHGLDPRLDQKERSRVVLPDERDDRHQNTAAGRIQGRALRISMPGPVSSSTADLRPAIAISK